MTNHSTCRSIVPSTAEADRYLDQINALAAKAQRRRRWYVPLPATTEEGVSTELLNPSEITDDQF
jgi:hypothetical protein